MGTIVTRVDGLTDDHPIWWGGTKSTRVRCPHILISPTPSSPFCCAGESVWTRGSPILNVTPRSETRRISAGNCYVNSENSWEDKVEKVYNIMVLLLVLVVVTCPHNLNLNRSDYCIVSHPLFAYTHLTINY